MSKHEGMPNYTMTKIVTFACHSGFMLFSSFVIRHSDFAIGGAAF